MTDFNITSQTTAALHATTTDTLFGYIADCRLKASQIRGDILFYALEYAYQPHPRFWRDLRTATVVEEMSRRYPEWRTELAMSGDSPDTVLKELEEIVYMNAFDEANAERLQALPVAERPVTSADASEWIFKALAEEGLQDELEYAERDGYRCGGDARIELHRLEQARQGIINERLGTIVARQFRDASMKGKH
ncbi:hypothetical protein [Paraburkholderia metrosideri]|uniref:Uncharacterized protein n=1 Tax=Paraburkholderia metrosideri TaxID=580937 RepID=A0ABN7HFV0_9BURK|nr:hypothetical protein [Paraburkholderia metrosideri]CAD6516439.1 hypothetical protein LMG28140_00781 [Paraburkholderia metrosideri]